MLLRFDSTVNLDSFFLSVVGWAIFWRTKKFLFIIHVPFTETKKETHTQLYSGRQASLYSFGLCVLGASTLNETK